MIVYKIRNQAGYFSIGGTYPRFSAKGKIWKRRGDLVCHLNQLSSIGKKLYEQQGVEIVEYEVVERETSVKSLRQCLDEIIARQLQKDLKQQQRSETYQREQRRKQYEQLQKEFGNG